MEVSEDKLTIQFGSPKRGIYYDARSYKQGHLVRIEAGEEITEWVVAEVNPSRNRIILKKAGNGGEDSIKRSLEKTGGVYARLDCPFKYCTQEGGGSCKKEGKCNAT